ncbi:MAG: indole-3-glycerol phosphate synthase TrpC, partial [Microthrixaceae bacterium]
MATYLDRILEQHRSVAALDDRDTALLRERCESMDEPRGFRAALGGASTLSVIAEVKRRSPSKGDLAVDLDPAGLAGTYEDSGASCLSVLTDGPHFGGSADDLASARQAVSLPVLREDFTVSANDVLDARLMGADA